jgi:hypothetical protein
MGEGFTKDELAVPRAMLRAKGNSIEGGTSEVNLNVVAKRVLGLLDHQCRAFGRAEGCGARSAGCERRRREE